jgi:hypothetical protein
MSQMPKIKAEVNIDKERDKKKSGLLGFLSRLTGGGSGGASGGIGAGGVGAGGLGGAAASGGLLATKAGLIGLILAGTTVAGGLGMVGWTAFGPGQGDRADNPALQLFASRPKETANPFGAAPVAKDGSSASLNFLAQANADKGGASGDAPVTDQSAASATEGDAAAAAATSATPHMGESVATNGAAPRTGLKDVKKMGELSKSFGGGGSGGASSASAAPLGGAGAQASNSASKGSLGGGFAGRNANTQSIGRGLSRARGGTATRQAMNALGQNRAAYSSQAGGRQYDGGAVGGNGTAGVDAGLPSAGAGIGDGGSQPTSTPNTAAQKNEFEAPPPVEGKNVTPYQKAINMAAMLLAAAMLMIMLIGQVAKAPGGGTTVAYILAGLAGVIGLAVVAIGAQISSGKYGQPLQGGLLAVAGGAVAAAAVLAATTMGSDATSQTATEGGTQTAAQGAAGASSGFLGLSPWVLLVGGAGAAALAGAMLTKPKSYPASEFDGKKVPDIGYQVKPGESVRYTA